jgi:hydroxypyruvate reductase
VHGLLVNTARAPIIEKDELIAELKGGRINACLDVFEHEPRVPEALLALDNVVLSPHLGTVTPATRKAMTRMAVDNIAAAFAGDPVLLRCQRAVVCVSLPGLRGTCDCAFGRR